MSAPFFSVIVPTYNRADLISETIESFLNQTFKNFELIIVDDGSTDDTKLVINKYLSDKRVKYIYQENKERGAARNHGAKEAKGQYLLFFDSDDIALPQHLEKAYTLIMKDGVSNVLWLHGNYNPLFKGKVIPNSNKPVSGWITKKLMHGNVIWICTIFVRKDFFDTLLFSEDRELSIAEDWEFAIRASLMSPIYYQPIPTVYMRQHENRSMAFPDKVASAHPILLKKIYDNTSILLKYKKTITQYSYLVIAIAYFSNTNHVAAKKYYRKALLANPGRFIKPKMLKWFIRIYLISFRNFNDRFNKVLYITYNGLCQPLGQSQIIPYIIGLSKEGYSFIVLSFEHHYEKDFEKEFKNVKAQLDAVGIQWIALKYHKYPRLFSAVYDILNGILKAMLIWIKEPYYIVHARSYVPTMIGFILKRIFKVKLIFDMRGMMADEKVDAGQWTYKRYSYRITKYMERLMLKGSNEIVVLTEKIKPYVQSFTYIKAPITVIPTCVDMSRFPHRDNKNILDTNSSLPNSNGADSNQSHNLVKEVSLSEEDLRNKIRKELSISDRIVIVYSGSIGTWYMFNEMVEFFKVVKSYERKAYFLLLNKNEHNYAKRILQEHDISIQDYMIKSVSPNDVYKFLWASDIGIFFYKPTFSRIATYPTKLAEYLACGLPVIGNVGVGDTEEIILKDTLGAVVYNFEEDEYKSAYDHSKRLINDLGFRQRAYHVVTNTMSIKVGIERYKDIYDNL